MPSRVESKAGWGRQTSKSTISSVSLNEGNVTVIVWIWRIFLLFALIVFVMPLALMLTPWWICMQPFERLCPTMMNGYYRLVTWPLTLSTKIRSYRDNNRFTERLTY